MAHVIRPVPIDAKNFVFVRYGVCYNNVVKCRIGQEFWAHNDSRRMLQRKLCRGSSIEREGLVNNVLTDAAPYKETVEKINLSELEYE